MGIQPEIILLPNIVHLANTGTASLIYYCCYMFLCID